MAANQVQHPLGTRANILLTSVFGPYARDDEYGSRKTNPMELYHNQVTRMQGAFSVRNFCRSAGLLMIACNIDAPCTILDFPSLERFKQELIDNNYDIVGISAIYCNFMKVKKMCELVRKYLPKATIVIGGHVTNYSGVNELDVDHIVKGEGISWFRKFLGQDEVSSLRHPEMYIVNKTRMMGVPAPYDQLNKIINLMPSVGCPVGCNFCSTSSFFGGKGKHIDFYETGDELFSIMCRLSEALDARSFFISDENFLLNRKRVLKLLELMKEHNKSWTLYLFSSAGALKQYTIEELIALGVHWVWIGLEDKNSDYSKLKGIDTQSLVHELQSHGISVLASTIIGLNHHNAENIDQVVDWAVNHNSVFHQFMLYMPIPGTPLYNKTLDENRILSPEVLPAADAHGQYRFNYRHDQIHDGLEEKLLVNAFQKDYDINGPSIIRMIKVKLNGWRRYKNHPSLRVRNRTAWDTKGVSTIYAGAVWAARKLFQRSGNQLVAQQMSSLLREITDEFGIKTKIFAPLIGRFLYITASLEEKRLARGWLYEPPTYYEKNDAALSSDIDKQIRSGRATSRIRWVES